VPQLTFNRNVCPRSLTFTLDWNQLTNRTALSLRASSQDHTPQASADADVTGVAPSMVADIIHSAVMVWFDMTPGAAARHLAQLVKQEGAAAHVTLL
jgi:hypothetical protein